MSKEKIIIKGAKENNLKNVSLELPKNKLIVFTGLSGSGKSSLAFNTIYEEGRRRYIDSLSTYARNFLGGTSKPNVDSIEGLSPSIAIEQKTTHNNPRSTVATTTEIYDFLRLLYARIGKPYCPNHKIPIAGKTNKDIFDAIFSYPENSKMIVLAPVISGEKGTHSVLLEKLRKQGFVRVDIDKQTYLLEEEIKLDKNKKHDIDIVIDRVVINEENRSRIFESIKVALEYGKDILKIRVIGDNEDKIFSKLHSCIHNDFEMMAIEPKLFSFNAPYGMCQKCKGLGVELRANWKAIVPNDFMTIREGGIDYYKARNDTNIEWQEFQILLQAYNINLDLPINRLTNAELDIIKYGSEEELSYTIKSATHNVYKRQKKIEGLIPKIERLFMDTTSSGIRKWLNKYMMEVNCRECNGKRLNKHALAVYIEDKNINDLVKLSIDDLYTFVTNINLSETEIEISNLVLTEITNRLLFLKNVGLGYLTLNRKAESLSGGESQRIRLATQIGTNLTGVLYVLDEPSIGLHQKDNQKLLNSLKQMVEIGNTLIVVEHDEDTITQADHIVDIGPFAGENGGKIIAQGTLEDIKNTPESITGQFLSKKEEIKIPSFRRSGNGKVLTIKGAKENNLKNIDVKIPLGKLIGVCGVSGSGKSTLINKILVNSIKEKLHLNHEMPGEHNSIENVEFIDKLIDIDQSPIGRTPRSNPATYTKVFDDIREVFANTSDAKTKGFTKSHFSFNVEGGRCEKCTGDGVIKIEMHFLPDVYVECDDCQGKRYDLETLEVLYKGNSIFDVLDMTVDKAYLLFANQPAIKSKLQTLKDVGLGYIKLGQSSTTLSGGEAQRIKLATYLLKPATGRTLYVLDEPTTGLHSYDVRNLVAVLNRIVDNGDSVIVIEHNLDVLKGCDYLIELGPEGGVSGGKIIASGTPEQISCIKESPTGLYLKTMLN
ncbi:cobalt ABC transporter ATP-binding protein [Mycoplasmopsis californica]|uniref:UvrABC system protein A n=1 Tax=Mycoplasmopsis equigenitalium TaxID=114883 RepID=A0ABY5J623_9BACT|nr:excinuclease ABC subunit UvrA [Mycoplasmopsis equigenitalium]UUD37133.1 excinuclease ABC subunit UvrA [Mycoplasmopsis equigenitalium]VEU69561.1 cobalt ABC transporter ATP-binding protein [Mycoplasmopsis californica]